MNHSAHVMAVYTSMFDADVSGPMSRDVAGFASHRRSGEAGKNDGRGQAE
jgi:hypothetical protein